MSTGVRLFVANPDW